MRENARKDRIDVVLPAGGRITGAFAQEAGTEIKALITQEGRTLLRRTLEVLRATERVERIVVVGPEATLEEARASGADGTLAEGATGPDNIFSGLEWVRRESSLAANRALIATTDLPFLTPEAVNAFLDACPPDADIAVPVVTREAFEAAFPGTASVYVPLRDGAVTLGCVFLVDPQTVLRSRPHVERIFRARKSQLQMARLIGGQVVFRFLTRRLTVGDIVTRAERILGCRGAAIIDAPAELAFDIDLPEEYAYACAHARRRAAGRPAVESRLPKETAP